jgi:hypothetical protein
MSVRELYPGRLVVSRRAVPQFREGTLFRIVSLNEISRFVACRAVGTAPFRLWYFRALDLAPVTHVRPAKLDAPGPSLPR